MKPLNIFAAILLLTFAARSQTTPPVEKVMTDSPDTSGYRCAATGWADLYTRDSSIVIRHDSDSILTVHHAKTDSVILGMLRPSGWTTCYSISPNGTALAAGTREGNVVIWDTHTAACIQVLKPQLRSVDCVYYVNELIPRLFAVQSQGISASCYFWIHPTTNREWPDDRALSGIAKDDCLPPYTFVPVEVNAEPLPGNPQPVIPDEMQIEGKVIVHVCVGKRGEVREWIIVREDPKGLGFGEAVTAVIPKWRFKPAMTNDHPVATWVAVPFKFRFKHKQ